MYRVTLAVLLACASMSAPAATVNFLFMNDVFTATLGTVSKLPDGLHEATGTVYWKDRDALGAGPTVYIDYSMHKLQLDCAVPGRVKKLQDDAYNIETGRYVALVKPDDVTWTVENPNSLEYLFWKGACHNEVMPVEVVDTSHRNMLHKYRQP